jgi:hypothetical protein
MDLVGIEREGFNEVSGSRAKIREFGGEDTREQPRQPRVHNLRVPASEGRRAEEDDTGIEVWAEVGRDVRKYCAWIKSKARAT